MTSKQHKDKRISEFNLENMYIDDDWKDDSASVDLKILYSAIKRRIGRAHSKIKARVVEVKKITGAKSRRTRQP